MLGEPRNSAESTDIARTENHAARRRASRHATDAEQSVISQRNRKHGRVERDFIAILMQAHAGAFAIEVRQATFRIGGTGGQLTPDTDEIIRNWRPRLSC